MACLRLAAVPTVLQLWLLAWAAAVAPTLTSGSSRPPAPSRGLGDRTATGASAGVGEDIFAGSRRTLLAVHPAADEAAPPAAPNRSVVEILPAANASAVRFAPKVIWMMWLQGEEQLLTEGPELNQIAYNAWRSMNPDWQIVLLTDANLDGYLPGLKAEVGIRTPASFSDLVRLRLITKHGGVWADMSLIPMMPLSTVIDSLVNHVGAFAFKFGRRRSRQRAKTLETYFLAARGPGNYLMAKWLEAYEARYRRKKGRFEYFQCHFEMVKVYNKDEEVHRMVDEMTTVPVSEAERASYARIHYNRNPNKHFSCPRRGNLCPLAAQYNTYAVAYKRPKMGRPHYKAYLEWVVSEVADKLPRLEHPIISPQ